MPGPPPKPLEEKIRLGNPGQRKLPKVIEGQPAIPLELEDVTVDEAVDTLLREGVSWIAKTDAPMVALLRGALSYLAELKGDPDVKPSDITTQFKVCHQMMAELGMTTASRSRLQLAVVQAESAAQKLRKFQQ